MGKRVSRDEWFNRSVNIHGVKYIYPVGDWPDYPKSSDKLMIVCVKHGLFYQSISSHTSGCGCKKCSDNKMSKSHEEWVSDFKRVHGDVFEYRTDNWPEKIRLKTKVEIVCRHHGVFSQTLNNHYNGAGCPECGMVHRSDKRRYTAKQWVDKFNHTHLSLYDYPIERWSKSLTIYSYVEIECRQHGVFSQMINHHRDGAGCPECSGHNQRYAYIHDVDGRCVKFGITNNPSGRLERQRLMNKIDITQIGTWFFDNVSDCKEAERVISRFTDAVMSKFEMPDGYTETCSYDHVDFIINTYEEFGGVRV